MGDRLCDQRLSGSGRAIQEDAFRGLDANPLIDLGLCQRILDRLANLFDLFLEAADLLERDVRLLFNSMTRIRESKTFPMILTMESVLLTATFVPGLRVRCSFSLAGA